MYNKSNVKRFQVSREAGFTVARWRAQSCRRPL